MKRASDRLASTEPVTWRIGLLALTASLLWSGNIVSIKVGLATIPPMWSAFWRMAAAVAAVALWARLNGEPVLIRKSDRGWAVVLGLLFTAQIALFNLAVHFTSPAYAVVMLNTHPILVNLISHFFVHDDRLTVTRGLGLAMPFAGIAYVMLGKPDAALAPDPMLGNSLMLLSALLLATRVVYTQRIVQELDPLRPVIWQMALSLPLFLALAVYLEPPLLQPLAWEAVAAILYQAVVVAGFCFVLWTSLLQRYSAGNLSVFGFTVPIFGILLSWAIFGEQITGRLLGGTAAVIAGIAIVTASKREDASDAT